jgi:hypothetical protein
MTPDARVTSFVNAMAKWERRVFKKIGRATPAETAALKKELEAIFDDNLSTKGKSRSRFGVRLTSGLTAADPPKFDQEVARVEDGPKSSQFYVVTKHRKDPNKIWRYVVIDFKGTPAIDDLQTRWLSKEESKKVAKGEWDKLPKGKWEKLAY